MCYSYLFKNSNANRMAICFNLKKKARKKTTLKTLLPSAINFFLEYNTVCLDCKLSLKFRAIDPSGGKEPLTCSRCLC